MANVSDPPRAIDAVVFDLGGVLIDWNPRHLYRKLFPGDDRAMEAFLASVATPDWNARQDAGRSFAEGVAALKVRHPGHGALIDAYDVRWEEMLGGPIDGSVALLVDLRARAVPLYGLTNWSRDKFPVARARFGFLDWFEGIVVSGEEGVVKPAPEIFHRLLDRYGLAPATTLFIDDMAYNAEAARAMGFHAHHFRAPEGLRAELIERGLIAPPAGDQPTAQEIG